jgi:hypothetical protein
LPALAIVFGYLSDGTILPGVQQIEDFFCYLSAVVPLAFLLEANLRLIAVTAYIEFGLS